MKKLTKKELIDQAVCSLEVEQERGDTEQAHSNADSILCDLLNSLGCEDVVKAFIKVDKWYA